MKIHALHDHVAETVIICCGHDQRRILADAAELAHHFCRDARALYLVNRCAFQAVNELIAGLEALRRLARASSAPQILGVAEVHSALNLVCLTAVHGVEPGASPASLSRAILLLCQAVPCPVRKLSLPPTVEVLAKNAVPEVRAAYETIRSWRRAGSPHVFLDRLHLLGCELRRLPSMEGELKVLVREIDIATAMFRYSLQTLALVDLGGTDEEGEGDLP